MKQSLREIGRAGSYNSREHRKGRRRRKNELRSRKEEDDIMLLRSVCVMCYECDDV